MHLLKNGMPALGRFVSKEATGSQINNQMVYKYTFEFHADDGRPYEVTAKSHTDELQDEDEEPLLYDPLCYSYAVMLDGLPGGPRIDSQGNIDHTIGAGPWWVMILPGATIVGHSLFVYFWFFAS